MNDDRFWGAKVCYVIAKLFLNELLSPLLITLPDRANVSRVAEALELVLEEGFRRSSPSFLTKN